MTELHEELLAIADELDQLAERAFARKSRIHSQGCNKRPRKLEEPRAARGSATTPTSTTRT